MTDKEKLAKIIKNNPGATLRVDNDNWYFLPPKPDNWDEMTGDEMDDWLDTNEDFCKSRQFPELGCIGGYGVLETMLWMHNIEVESV